MKKRKEKIAIYKTLDVNEKYLDLNWSVQFQMVVLYNDHFLFLFFWSQLVILKASDKFVVRSDYQQGMSGCYWIKHLGIWKKRGNSMVDKCKTQVLMLCDYFGVFHLHNFVFICTKVHSELLSYFIHFMTRNIIFRKISIYNLPTSLCFTIKQ